MRNKPESILWSLKMIKRASESPKGCTLHSTGGFIADGQVDDLIELVESCIKTDVAKVDDESFKKSSRWFNNYWGEKSLKKNE